MTSVTIEDSVKRIGNSAFYEYDVLTAITILDSVTAIREPARAFCDAPTEIEVSGGNTTYESEGGACSTFLERRSCSVPQKTVRSYTVPDGVTTVGNFAFYHRGALATVTIGDGVTTIENSAFFRSCSALASAIIPDRVSAILDFISADDYALDLVTIPDSITKIADSGFDSPAPLSASSTAIRKNSGMPSKSAIITTPWKTPPFPTSLTVPTRSRQLAAPSWATAKSPPPMPLLLWTTASISL